MMKQLWKGMVRFAAVLIFILGLTLGVQADVKAAVLSAPENVVQVDAGKTSVDIQWDTVFGSGEDVSYIVHISKTADFAQYNESKAYYSTSEYISGLTAGTTYYVRVGAYIDVTESGKKNYKGTINSKSFYSKSFYKYKTYS